MNYNTGNYPLNRMRRSRMKKFARDMVQESNLSPHDLIYPIFVVEGKNVRDAIPSMPGQFRYSVDQALTVVEQVTKLGIPAIALFPSLDAAKKDPEGKEAINPKGLVPEALRSFKTRFPEVGIIADLALDPYTSHGQDGLIDAQGKILNDATCARLAEQAICYAEAGADIVAPSDMMDGRVCSIRNKLEEKNFHDVILLSYAAKYASAFYGPFRDAVQSKNLLGKADKKTYQMNPANSDEALRECSADLAEGADWLMVKPGLPYLDILRRVKETFGVPTFAYNVSGEYAMLKAAAANGWINERECVLETLLSFKRAGADGVLTYHALDAAAWLQEK